jgi:Fur family peroxide stress response transcriptional regulator
MKLNTDTFQEELDRFTKTFHEAGLKFTHQRIEIFREIAVSDDHPDADTIYKGVRERLPTVSLDTVYRTLWLFIELGLITALGPSGNRLRFDANVSSHHHFVCSRCGLTRDFYSDEFDQLDIPDQVKALGSPEKTQVEIRGRCFKCKGEDETN